MSDPVNPRHTVALFSNILNPKILVQFCSFAFVGALGTIVHYAVLIFFVQIVTIDPVYSSTLGFIAGAFVNYFLNYRYTFKSSQKHPVTMIRFFLIATAGMFINMGIMYYLINKMHIYYLISQIIATTFVLMWNFILNKFWTFSEKNTS